MRLHPLYPINRISRYNRQSLRDRSIMLFSNFLIKICFVYLHHNMPMFSDPTPCSLCSPWRRDPCGGLMPSTTAREVPEVVEDSNTLQAHALHCDGDIVTVLNHSPVVCQTKGPPASPCIEYMATPPTRDFFDSSWGHPCLLRLIDDSLIRTLWHTSHPI
jgi:hypothetical protein